MIRFMTFSLLVAGIASLVGGVLALLNPMFATRAVVTLAALVLAVSGALQLFGAFAERTWQARLPSLVLAIAVLVLGLAVLANPAAGIAALTFTVALLFALSGVAKLAWGFAHRREPSFWPLFVSGALSLLLAWLVYGNLASGRADILGTLLGVELMLNGLALMTVGALARRALSRGQRV